MKKLWLVAIGVVSCWLLLPSPAWAYGGVVSPSPVMPGGTVTVTGTVALPGCPVPGNVILQGIGLLANGSGFVAGPYDAAGHFSLRARLSSTVGLGPNAFQIRCAARSEPLGPTAGGELGGPAANATFTVVGLPRTGGSIGPLSDAAATAIGFTLVATGLAALFTARRRSLTRE